MNKDERIKELETIALKLFDMVHESDLTNLKIEANELYERIVNNSVLDDVIECYYCGDKLTTKNCDNRYHQTTCIKCE